MDKEEMLKKLKGFIYSEYGTAKNYAKIKGVSAPFISAVLTGKKEPTQEMFTDAGITKKTVYWQA